MKRYSKNKSQVHFPVSSVKLSATLDPLSNNWWNSPYAFRFYVLCMLLSEKGAQLFTFLVFVLGLSLLCYIAARPNDSSVLICFYSQEAYVSEISPPICWSAHHILSDIFLTRLAFVDLQAISWKFLLTLVSSYEKKKLDSTRLAVCNCFVRSTYVVLFLLLFYFCFKTTWLPSRWRTIMAHTPRCTFIRYTFSTPHWCNEIINQSYGSSSMHQANRHGQDYLLKINSSMRSW